MDTIHTAVKNALVKDGWTITDDPYTIQFKGENLYADLAAERPLAAERNGDRIVVEIKSFIGSSVMRDLEAALGQYTLYRTLLKVTAPDRRLYLAISDDAYRRLSDRKIFVQVQKEAAIAMIVVDLDSEEVLTWIE